MMTIHIPAHRLVLSLLYFLKDGHELINKEYGPT